MLVKFDCMVQDMYEEEFYISVLKKKDSKEESLDDLIFYKYCNELPSQVMKDYDFENVDHKFTKERGNILATSIPNLNKWINEE